MKLKFKQQAYQTRAVQAVVECFKGQPNTSGIGYLIDLGAQSTETSGPKQNTLYEDLGFKNSDLALNEKQILANIQNVQRQQNLPQSTALVSTRESRLNLDVEMETGTGKTYCYIKTMFEMNRQFGWSKFIVVVPSIAIREGVFKSLQITADHFQEIYHKKAKFFIYNSKQPHNLLSFSSDAGLNVMVINIQAFNAKGKENRRIYEELDEFQSRRPIDVIKANRPILILDEPQKMEGAKTLESLKEFNPLFILRYSATHRTQHNTIHRLDALDAYNQKLVKKIAVRGISIKGLAGTNSYLFLEGIDVSKQAPVARIELEIRQKSGIKRMIRRLKKGDNLHVFSEGLDQYKGFVISNINAGTDTVEFTNGLVIHAGEVVGDVNETALRRIQIREAIKAHFDKEQILYHQGIKVLTLFFIDEVAKYRVYTDSGEEGGEYAKIFEEEYREVLDEVKQNLFLAEDYAKYLGKIAAGRTHNGYFAIDKTGKRMIDPVTGKKTTETEDSDAYDLILKDKERLLSLKEPTRFIFSHSALREGWDNPNVFVICTLKHSDNTISRRQEVGRGLRLSVNQHGERQDDLATVHQINVLTVVASESYRDFVSGLQQDIRESLSVRPRLANEAFFAGKILVCDGSNVEITQQMARQIYKYLIKNDYTDENDNISPVFIESAKNGEFAELPEELQPYKEQIFQLIDSVYSDVKLPAIEDERSKKVNSLNANFEKKEFKELWERINRKAVYSVKFDSNELIKKCVFALDKELTVEPLIYTIQNGEQAEKISYDQLESGDSFKVKATTTEYNRRSIHSTVKYDLIGKIAEGTQLTRKTIAAILSGVARSTFVLFKTNPESFVSGTTRIIQEQKANVVIEHLSYDAINETHDIDIFTEAQLKQEFNNAGEPLKRHIYDYVITDSKNERRFVEELDTSTEVVVYAKLPRGFSIPTPVGNYNPDWAISFKEGSVKHVYFVAETKGSMSSLELREIEKTKIECARKFFSEINQKINPKNVKYDVVDSFSKLMELVS